jgi:ketosteroid isomerase-like protein
MKIRIAIFLLLMWAWPGMAADAVYDINQLVKKGKPDQALAQIDAYLAAQPKNAWGRNITQMRFLKGVLLADLKRPADAIQVFTRLIQDYPDLPEPYNNLAALYVGQGQYEKARDVLERGLRTDPVYATAYRNLNEVYAQLANRAYDHTLQASRESSPALIKELCDNYSRVANQAVGRRQSTAGDVALVRDIPKTRSSAAAPPSKVDIDEMAVAAIDDEPPVPPAFNNPGYKPPPVLPASPAAVVPSLAKPDAAKSPPAKETAMPPAEKSASVDEKAVLAAVNAWAASWSRKDIASYLAYYSKDFHTPNGMSRGDWAQQRRERIGKPKSITVTVEAPKVVAQDATHATVSFRQGYRSDNLQSSTRKTVVMEKVGARWLIQEERVGG